MSADAAKYWAFISYSHRDARVARTLQRALETYRLPARLIGRHGPDGALPRALKPIFLDRDELQAGADLHASVRAALERSRFLIVVCTPDAVRSPWVNREIAVFKEVHGAARVLAVIVAGEPFAARTTGREAEECFPPALCANGTDVEGAELEPIAADLRASGDGWRRTIQKLVAGMIGVGVDELIRRDAQRRTRRFAVVAAAALAGMAAMTVLTITAVRSRNREHAQRAQAEDLLEFMLGDLRKKLEPVGRLDVLDGVGEKALGYYAQRDADELDGNSLGRRSRALHLIGQLREQRGQLEAALTAFQGGAATTAQLLQRAPNDARRIFDHAQSVYWVGYVAWRRGQAQAAEQAFQEYLSLAERLVRLDPANVEWQAETAYARENVGVVYLGSGRAADALRAFTDTRATWQRIIGAKPGYAFDQANTLGWISRAHEALGEYHAAIEALEAKIMVLQQLPNARTNQSVQRSLQNMTHELGGLEMTLGRIARAGELAVDAVQRAEALVATDPQNKAWLEQLCFARTLLAEVQTARGQRTEAAANMRSALDDCARLEKIDATVANWRVNLKGRALTAAAALVTPAQRDALIAQLTAYLAGVREFTTADRALTETRALIIARAELGLAHLLVTAGRSAEATEHWRAAAARIEPYARQGHLAALTALARAQLGLGAVEEAQALARRIEATPFRHPAYAELASMLSDGAGPAKAQPLTRSP
jgi:tetratricopeptide (TPR) repeat protein